MHLACYTRPDIMVAVNTLAQLQKKPSRPAKSNALLHIIRYLKGTPDLGITFSRPTTQSTTSPVCLFSDANWASDTDPRSTSGVVLLVNQAPVHGYAKRQTLTARSTCEAEFIAADLAVREAIWAQQLWADISRLPLSPIPLHVDNQSAVHLACREDLKARNRHFLIRHETVREAIAAKVITPSPHPSLRRPPTDLPSRYQPLLISRAFLSLLSLQSGGVLAA